MRLRCVSGWALLLGAVGLSSPVVSAEDASESASSRAGLVSEPIQSAELLHTAHTLGRGQVALHPLLLSSTVGVGRNLDIQFPTLGILDGPSLGIEYTALDTDSLVLSVEPFFRSRSVDEEEIWGWGLKAVSSGATMRATFPQGSNRLNLATAAVYDSHIDRVAVPLEVEFDLVTSDRTVIQFGMGTDLANDLRGSGNLSWMVHWNHGWGRYRLSLGTTVTHGQASGVWDRSSHLAVSPSEGLGIQPHVAMWWLLGGDQSQSSRTRMERPTGWHSDSSASDSSQGALSLQLPRMSYGLSYGLGVRYLSLVEVPDGVAPRLDLGLFEVRRALDSSYRFGPKPARLDLQIDVAHAFWSYQATRWPRLPVSVYTTWLRPTRRSHSMALSSGVYTELGLDRFVRDEVLVRRPAAALGAAGRIGREKHRRRIHSGVYLRGVAGVNLATDPDHPHVTRYLRLGIETAWTWGGGPRTGAQP